MKKEETSRLDVGCSVWLGLIWVETSLRAKSALEYPECPRPNCLSIGRESCMRSCRARKAENWRCNLPGQNRPRVCCDESACPRRRTAGAKGYDLRDCKECRRRTGWS